MFHSSDVQLVKNVLKNLSIYRAKIEKIKLIKKFNPETSGGSTGYRNYIGVGLSSLSMVSQHHADR